MSERLLRHVAPRLRRERPASPSPRSARHKLRAALTVLGIVVGVTTVIAMVSLIAGFNNNVIGDLQAFGATLVSSRSTSRVRPRRRPRPRDAPPEAADLRGRHRVEGALPLDAVGVAGALLVSGQQRRLGSDGQLRRRRGESRHHRRGGLRLSRRELQADWRGQVHQRDRRATLGGSDRHRLRHRRRDLPVRRPDRQVGAVRRPALRSRGRDGRAGRDDVRVHGCARATCRSPPSTRLSPGSRRTATASTSRPYPRIPC